MLINPGFVYLLLSLILLPFNKKWIKKLSLFLPLIAIILILTTSGCESISHSYLNMELILFEYNRISAIIGVLFASVGLLNQIFSLTLLEKKDYIFINFFTGSAIAILFVGDFLLFFFFWELMSFSAFALIYDRSNKNLQEIGSYYLLMHVVGGLCLLAGIVLQYTSTGSLALTTPQSGRIFFLIAIGIKVAFIGLHTWLTRSYSKVPFYLTGFLAAFTTKIGVYAFYRLFNNSHLEYFGVAMALGGVILALQQVNIRKLLSYHLISQTGYMLTGIAIAGKLATNSGIFHLVNHVLYKALLFLTAGCVIYSTGQRSLSSTGKLYKKLPLVSLSALIGALAISGFPFLNGFVSKLLLKKSTGADNIVVYGLLLASIGTVLSFTKFVYYGFISGEETEIKRQVPLSMKIALVLFIIPIILIGVKPSLFEYLFSISTQIKYYKFDNILNLIQPFVIASIIWALLPNLFKPKEKKFINFDLYNSMSKKYTYLSKQVSKSHNGNLTRYITWSITVLVIIWLALIY